MVDTGATHHICCNLSSFRSHKKIDSKVILPNSFTISVTNIGTVWLSNNLHITNVLFVPNFQFNLLSISSLTSQIPCFVSFMNDACHIQDIHCTKTIGIGKRVGNLYVLEDSGVSLPISCNVSSTSTDMSYFFFWVIPTLIAFLL